MANNVENTNPTKDSDIKEIDLGGVKDVDVFELNEEIENLNKIHLDTSEIKQILTSSPSYNPKNWYQQIALTANNLWVNINNTWNNFINANGTTEFTGTGAGFKDEDDMASDSATAVASQQSIKAYVDANTDSAQAIAKSFTAGENIDNGDAVFVASGSEVISAGESNDASTDQDFGNASGGNIDKLAQSFQLSEQSYIAKAKVKLATVNSPTDNVVITLESDSAGSPSGTPLATVSIAYSSLTSTLTEYTVTFDATETLTASTTYWLVFDRSGTASDTNKFKTGKGGSYGNGQGYYINVGGSWTDLSADLHFDLLIEVTADSVYRTRADNTDHINVIGIANETQTYGNAIEVYTQGTKTLVGWGLTANNRYYLSETAGAITLTPTSNIKVVGWSLSSTELLILYDVGGFDVEGSGNNYGDGSDGDVVISSNTSLTEDKYYNNLTISSSSVLSPSGYRIFVKNILTIDSGSSISAAGGAGGNGAVGGLNAPAAAGGTAGTGLSAGYYPACSPGEIGGAGGQGKANANGDNGSAGVNGDAYLNSIGVNGVAGTTGGDGGDSPSFSGGTGAAGGTAGSVTLTTSEPRNISNATIWVDFTANVSDGNPLTLYNSSAGSGSGGGGAGGSGEFDGSAQYGGGGGGAGGSGAAGGILGIFAKKIINNGDITVQGGAGGDGGDGNDGTAAKNTGGGGGGAGGAGGSGGVMILAYNQYSGSGTRTYTGGAGGTGGTAGTGTGTGTAGTDGADGNTGGTGTLLEFQL